MRGSGLFPVFFLWCDMVGGGWFPVTKGGACLLGCLPALPLALFLPPIPPPPFPGGEGGVFLFISPGASPPAPLRLNPRGACSPCRCGTRRGACPRRCRLGGRRRYPAGGLPSLSPANPAFSLLSFPHPPARARRALFPAGRGRLLLYFAGGFAPGTPAAEPIGLRKPGKKRSLRVIPPPQGHLYGRGIQCRKRSNAGDARGEAPCIRKL